jgi:molybdate transport system substrate-binding protein
MGRTGQFGMAMVFICALVGIGIDARGEAETLTVAAAHSLRAPFQEILTIFESESGIAVAVTYGSSHRLRRQIEEGSSVDVFLSESLEEVDRLRQQGLTLFGGPTVYAQTSVVLVMSSTSTATAVSLGEASSGPVRVALLDPRASSQGLVAMKTLKQLDPVAHRSSRLLYAHDTDNVVRLVSTGEADVGLVYRVDAINSSQVRIIDEAPAGRSIPVLFGQAVVSTCRESSLRAAEQFIEFMMSPRIQKLLLKYGFEAMPSGETVGS